MRIKMLAVGAAAAVTMLGAGASTAAAAPTAGQAPAQVMDDSCWYPLCGVVYNRSGHTLLVMRSASGPNASDCDGSQIKYLPDGKASDIYTGWEDVDCWTEDFGRPWHRISSHPVWIY
jgi:hypothetical protein